MKIKDIVDIFSKSGKLVAVNAVIEYCEQLPSTSSSSVNRRSVHTSVTRITDKCRHLKKFKRPDAQKKRESFLDEEFVMSTRLAPSPSVDLRTNLTEAHSLITQLQNENQETLNKLTTAQETHSKEIKQLSAQQHTIEDLKRGVKRTAAREEYYRSSGKAD